MIKLYCDVCGDEIEVFRCKNSLPENDDTVRSDFPFSHSCRKCEEIFKTINVKEVIRLAIINKRIDIPKEGD